MNNPYKIGDKVRIMKDIKDAYQEIWHHKDDILQIKSIAKDGQGLMFYSDLGLHFKDVNPVQQNPVHHNPDHHSQQGPKSNHKIKKLSINYQ